MLFANAAASSARMANFCTGLLIYPKVEEAAPDQNNAFSKMTEKEKPDIPPLQNDSSPFGSTRERLGKPALGVEAHIWMSYSPRPSHKDAKLARFQITIGIWNATFSKGLKKQLKFNSASHIYESMIPKNWDQNMY